MLAGIQVPQPERAVAVGTGQQAPVRAEGYAVLVFLAAHVHLEGGARPARGRVPEPDRSVAVRAGNLSSGLKATPFTLRVAAASLLAVSCPVSRVVLIAQAWPAQDTQHAAMADRSAIRESMAWLPAPT